MTALLPAHRVCVVIPTYDNPLTIRRVVEAAREHVDTVIVVDDHSAAEGEAACAALATDGLATVTRRARNGGKGAAVKTGLAHAAALGMTHAFQIDADGQHDLSQMPAFVAASAARPDAAIFATPVYDASAPAARLAARKFTKFWVDLEAGRGVIGDAMVGFRIYPLAATQAIRVRGDRMDYDVEVAVRLAWAGVPIVNLPVAVIYPDAASGGVSHFQPWRDNLRFSWLHSKLCTTKAVRRVLALVGLGRRKALPKPEAP